MSGMNQLDEFADHVASLDQLVARDGAWIEFRQYGGGPDEGHIEGNVQGFRRLGIEFLKATIDSDHACHVDLEYLVSPESTINFDSFAFADVQAETSESNRLFARLLSFGCMLCGFVCLVVFLIGLATILTWFTA